MNNENKNNKVFNNPYYSTSKDFSKSLLNNTNYISIKDKQKLRPISAMSKKNGIKNYPDLINQKSNLKPYINKNTFNTQLGFQPLSLTNFSMNNQGTSLNNSLLSKKKKKQICFFY